MRNGVPLTARIRKEDFSMFAGCGANTLLLAFLLAWHLPASRQQGLTLKIEWIQPTNEAFPGMRIPVVTDLAQFSAQGQQGAVGGGRDEQGVVTAANVAELFQGQGQGQEDATLDAARRSRPAGTDDWLEYGLGQEQEFEMDSPHSHSLSDLYLFDGLKARDMAELMRGSQLRCVACAERDDFKASIRDQLFHLSIRSLKNLIALRGQTCKECKSKKFLQVRSMQIAHLPPKAQLLPILRFHNALIFPSIKAHLYLREAHDMVFMNKMWKSKSRRFGVMPNEGHGTVVKLLDYEALPDGRGLAVVQGIQRFTSNRGQGGKEIDQNGPGGIPVQNVTLFVDAPVFAKDVPEILDLAKRVRRAFHAFDTDAMAAQRAKTLGNPPEESLGAEVLSHWMSMALPMTHLERLWLMEVRSTRLRLAGLAEKLGVATEQDKRREELGWEARKASEHKNPSAERARKGDPKGKGGKASAKER